MNKYLVQISKEGMQSDITLRTVRVTASNDMEAIELAKAECEEGEWVYYYDLIMYEKGE